MKKLALMIGALTPTLSFAFFCPNNFNQIEVGFTLDQVIQQCGKPDVMNQSKQDSASPQQWDYYIPQNYGNPYQARGTIKTSIFFDKDGNVINLSVNGIGVVSTPICGGRIQIGDSRDTVKAACGTPAMTSKQSTDETVGPQQPQVTITEVIYNAKPDAKLIFENGILKQQP